MHDGNPQVLWSYWAMDEAGCAMKTGQPKSLPLNEY